MNNFFDQKNAARMGKILSLLGLFVALYAGMKFINEVKKFGSTDSDPSKVSTIDVSGQGEAFAIPDTATESFTVEQKASTVHEAQATVTKKVNDVIAFLKSSGIAEKDIKTTNYSAYPEQSSPVPCYSQVCPMSQRMPTIIGYDVSQTITLKIRDTSAVGKIIDGLGSRGVTGLSGPDFSVADPDSVQAEARKKAIDDAETKAKVLAKDLGVDLVRIVRFSENNGGGYPMPMFAKADMGMASGAAAPQVPAGENKYSSNVTVTYEIR